jgi:uncharacterized protein YeaO (DUF488 family)
MIQIKRAYDSPAKKDGARFLVDHLWPRGLKKEEVKAKLWIKEVSPSNELRRWFGHEPEKWEEFQRRYFAELDQDPEVWLPLIEAARQGDITLVFGARDVEHNNAAALKAYLETQLKANTRRRPPNLEAAAH